MKSEKQEALLRCMGEVLNQNGFHAEVMEDKDAPMLLRIEARRQGKVQQDVMIECCFIPIGGLAEDEGLLQFFVTLFAGVPDLYPSAVRRACDYCNNFTALGHFAYFEEAQQLYLKHITLVDGSLNLEKLVPFVADNISLLLASVGRFVDGLAAIAFSGTPVEAAVDQGLFPSM